MQDTPALAIPVVLTRLKQKEAEWKRAQSEWNKVWRMMDEANYARSLDFLSLTSSSFTFGAGNRDGALLGGYSVSGGGVNSYASGWKGKDRRAFAAGPLVREIEMIREEQIWRRGRRVGGGGEGGRKRWQLEFWMGDVGGEEDEVEGEAVDPKGKGKAKETETALSTVPKDTLQTTHLLLLSFLDRTPTAQLPVPEKKRIEGFLKGFTALFWNVDLFGVGSTSSTSTPVAPGIAVGNGANGEDVDMTVSAAAEEDDGASSSGSRSKAGGSSSRRSVARHGGGDLRKKLLKSEHGKSSSRNKGAKGQGIQDNGMRFLAELWSTITPSNAPAAEGEVTAKLMSGKTVFWTNTNFYVLLRLMEVRQSNVDLVYLDVSAKCFICSASFSTRVSRRSRISQR